MIQIYDTYTRNTFSTQGCCTAERQVLRKAKKRWQQEWEIPMSLKMVYVIGKHLFFSEALNRSAYASL